MEKQWDEPPVYRWFFNLRDSQGRVVARITGKFQRNKVSLKITLAWEACERWWRYNKWGRRGWSGPWWRHLIKIGGGGEAISGEPPDDRVSILNYALMATRELTGIGQAYQIPVPSSLNFGNRSSIVTANRRTRLTEWMKGNILLEDGRSVISRERVLGRRNWKNREEKERRRINETIKMQFFLVDREESRSSISRCDSILSRLMNPRVGSWSSSYEEEEVVYSDLTCYQLCPCYSSCMPVKLPSLLVFRSLACLASPSFSL